MDFYEKLFFKGSSFVLRRSKALFLDDCCLLSIQHHLDLLFTVTIDLGPMQITEFIIIGTYRESNKLTNFFLTNIINHSLTSSDTVPNLGVTFDGDFNFRKHISLTCRRCFYLIRDVRRIFCYFSRQNHCYSTHY